MEFQLALSEIVRKYGKDIYFDVRRLKGLLMDAQVEKKYIVQITSFLETGHLKQVLEFAPTQIDTLKQNLLVADIGRDTGYDCNAVLSIVANILASVGIENKPNIEKNISTNIVKTAKNMQNNVQKTNATENFCPEIKKSPSKVFTQDDARNFSSHVVIPCGYIKIGEYNVLTNHNCNTNATVSERRLSFIIHFPTRAYCLFFCCVYV